MKGFSGQTANLQEWHRNNDTILAAVDANGALSVNQGYISLGGFQADINAGSSDMRLYSSGKLVLRSRTEIGGTGNIATNEVPLIIKSASSQTANLQEWHNSSGTVLASMNKDGGLTAAAFAGQGGGLTGVNADTLDSIDSTGFVAISPASSARNTIVAASSTVTPLVVKGASGQSDNLQEWQQNGGTVSASVSSVGDISGRYITAGGGFIGDGSGLTNLPAGSLVAATDGSAAEPIFTFASDTDTGMYLADTDKLGLSVNGYRAVEIAPTQTRFYNDSGNFVLSIGCTSGYDRPIIKMCNTAADDNLGISIQNDAGDEVLRIQENGRVVAPMDPYDNKPPYDAGDTVGSITGAYSFDYDVSRIQRIGLGGNTELSFTNAIGYPAVLHIDNSGSYTVTFSGSDTYKWVGGTPANLDHGYNILTITYNPFNGYYYLAAGEYS